MFQAERTACAKVQWLCSKRVWQVQRPEECGLDSNASRHEAKRSLWATPCRDPDRPLVVIFSSGRVMRRFPELGVMESRETELGEQTLQPHSDAVDQNLLYFAVYNAHPRF